MTDGVPVSILSHFLVNVDDYFVVKSLIFLINGALLCSQSNETLTNGMKRAKTQ